MLPGIFDHYLIYQVSHSFLKATKERKITDMRTVTGLLAVASYFHAATQANMRHVEHHSTLEYYTSFSLSRYTRDLFTAFHLSHLGTIGR